MYHAVLAAFLLAAPAAYAADGGEEAEGLLAFRLADEEETGLKKIMADWAEFELKEQGGAYGSHGWWPWGLTAFDFDNDGDLDLLPSHHGKPGSRLFRNNLQESGKLTFADITKDVIAPGEKLPGADDRPWTWDFDGDGWLDIAGFSDEGKPGSFFNKGGKTFERIPGFTFYPLSHAGEVVDLNDDGYPDLYSAGRKGVTRHLYVPDKRMFAVEAGDPVEGVPDAFTTWFAEVKKKPNNRFIGYRVMRADLNGDGMEDIVISCAGGYGADTLAKYYLGSKDGTVSESNQTIGLPEEGTATLIRDLTGDGVPEVLVTTKDKEKAGLYLNDGKGSFSRMDSALSTFLSTSDSYPLKAIPVDLDYDGDLDLVVSAPRGGREEIHENMGGGTFRKVLGCGGWDANPIVICDIDNDGLLDVCIGGPKNTISLYLNATPSPGNRAEIHLRADAPNPFAAGSVVEVFKGGDLDKVDARPIAKEKGGSDARAIMIGLGVAVTFDVRVTFPAKESKVHVWKGLAAGKRWKLTSDGKAENL